MIPKVCILDIQMDTLWNSRVHLQKMMESIDFEAHPVIKEEKRCNEAKVGEPLHNAAKLMGAEDCMR